MKFSNDDAFQAVFVAIKSVRWRDCEQDNNYEWYYAEEEHYVIRDKKTHAYWFAKAKSPYKAFEYVKGKLEQ